MKVELAAVQLIRDGWRLNASASFGEGIHLISGPVGSGKSTLSMILTALIQPDAGEVTYEGLKSVMLSMQFPEYHITGATVGEEIRSWGLEPAPLLEELRLDERVQDLPRSLSRGELKRLHLACVLASSWDFLVLDEPFSSLDCAQKRRLCTRIEERKHGITILFTHERAVLPRIDHLWEMSEGALIERGAVPDAIPHWSGAPPYIHHALSKGIIPENIRIEDVAEALCKIRD